MLHKKLTYILEPYKGPRSRYICPQCQNRQRTFVRYIHTVTGEHAGTDIGRCNREISCGYHRKPSPQDYRQEKEKIAPPSPNISLRLRNAMQHSLTRYDENRLALFLNRYFAPQAVEEAFRMYGVGTARHWPGATVFWQTDRHGQVRTGKVMLYDEQMGRRVKEPFPHIHWAHSLLKIEGYRAQQCLFGEHLLDGDAEKTIGLVESEKTALIAHLYNPRLLWLAAGGLSLLNADKLKHLKGRKIILFPDLNGAEKWQKIISENPLLWNVRISGLLEQKAAIEDIARGLDLADFILRELEKKKQESYIV